MELINESTFDSLSQNIGKFHLQKKKVLIPEMNRTSARLIAAAFRGFGIFAEVLETGKGLDLGLSYDSSIQPGREATIRTLMYQAVQHFNRYGNRRANRGSVQRPFNQ